MIFTFEDGTVVHGFDAIKERCQASELEYWRRRSIKGLGRAKEKRAVRLPEDWRARLDRIFGAETVIEFTKEVPANRPAIVVTPNALDTAWAHALQAASSALCLVRGRINYIDIATGMQMRGNPKGMIIWLFADDPCEVQIFAKEMSVVGCVLSPLGG